MSNLVDSRHLTLLLASISFNYVEVGFSLYFENSIDIVDALLNLEKDTSMSRLVRAFTLLLLAGGLMSSQAASASEKNLDFKQYQDQAVTVLRDYLKIDTTVPPGNEARGAEYLKGILNKNGIEAELFETAPNRSVVYARLKGNGKKKAVILLNHIDVVPAEAKDWKYPPFGGEIHDGEIWGRGALDMKGMGVIELMAMIMLKQSGIELDRDIIYLGTPDEEVGGEFGAGWLQKHKPEIIKSAEFLLNEGFPIESDEKGKAKYWGVDYAEKSVLWLELTTEGAAGHASMPIPGAATYRLVRALKKIDDAGPNFRLLPEVEEYFKKIAATEDESMKKLYASIDSSIKEKKHSHELLSDLLKSSMLRNTISLTVMKAGYKTNVIPASASAQLDCRLLPDVKKDEFIKWIKGIIDDPTVKISVLEWNQSDPSSMETEMVAAIKKVAAAEDAKVPVVPVIVPWFTDSHWFRELGVQAYGFQPCEVDKEHFATMHGKDERISIDSFKKGVVRMYKILKEVAAADAK